MVTLKKFLIKMLMMITNMLTPPCEVISQHVSHSMDQPLSLLKRLQVRIHLLGCKLCTRYEKQLLAMRKVIEDNADEIVASISTPRLSDAARQRMKSKIKPSKKD